MRLTCPNCDAQYEVDERAIPPEGRDVQCSNCGHLWFEPSADGGPLEDEQPGDEGAPPPEAEAGPQPEAGPEPDAPPPGIAAPPQRRELDTSVATLLREEAAREAEARRAERTALESQPDLGLASPRPPVRVAPRQPAPARPPAVTRPASKFPDIDVTDASLRGDAPVAAPPVPADDPQPSPAPVRRGGFRRGFALAVLVAAVLFAVYVQAPALRSRVPAAAPALDGYVATVNDLRRRLDAAAQGLRQAVSAGSGNS